jgi:hypothetical protein
MPQQRRQQLVLLLLAAAAAVAVVVVSPASAQVVTPAELSAYTTDLSAAFSDVRLP